jgi:hypothetical protein
MFILAYCFRGLILWSLAPLVLGMRQGRTSLQQEHAVKESDSPYGRPKAESQKVGQEQGQDMPFRGTPPPSNLLSSTKPHLQIVHAAYEFIRGLIH